MGPLILTQCPCGRELGNDWDKCISCGTVVCRSCLVGDCEDPVKAVRGVACVRCVKSGKATQLPGKVVGPVRDVARELRDVVVQLQAVMAQVKADVAPSVGKVVDQVKDALPQVARVTTDLRETATELKVPCANLKALGASVERAASPLAAAFNALERSVTSLRGPLWVLVIGIVLSLATCAGSAVIYSLR